jgi:hypothetical protein
MRRGAQVIMKNVGNAIVILLAAVVFNACGHYSYFKAALIVKTDSSMVSGYVEKISESDLSTRVRFKERLEDAGSRAVPVADIDHLVFTDDSSVFRRVKYRRSGDSAAPVEYRLAKKLLAGWAELYKLQLPQAETHIFYEINNTFVYILKIDTNYLVLDKTEFIDTTLDDGSEGCLGCVIYVKKLKKNYIAVLNWLLRDDTVLRKRLRKLELRDDQILPLIDDVNKKHPEVPRAVLFRKERVSVRHCLSVGFRSETGGPAPGYSVFEIGYSAGIQNPHFSEKISSDFGLFLVNENYRGDSYNAPYSTMYLKMPVTLIYHFNNDKISPFTGLGISFYVLPGGLAAFFRATAGVTFFKGITIALAIEADDYTAPGISVGFNLGGGGGARRGSP